MRPLMIIALSLLLIGALGVLNYRWFTTDPNLSPINLSLKQTTKTWDEAETVLKISAEDKLLSSRVQTHSRPIFSENRRKFVPIKVEVEQVIKEEVEEITEEAPPADPPNIKLIGVSIQASKKSALIIDLETNVDAWFSLNGIVQDWRITVIDKEFILLASAGESFKIFLYEENMPKDSGEN